MILASSERERDASISLLPAEPFRRELAGEALAETTVGGHSHREPDGPGRRPRVMFTVSVVNSMPTGNPVCTMIYGTYELNIDLGRDVRPGVTYTVRVNDKTTTFRSETK